MHLALAKSFIVRHLGQPDLAPADVAEACGVSQSYLHRLFANDGATVSSVRAWVCAGGLPAFA